MEEAVIPKVSVVIPNFNGESFLGACLDSLLAQRFKDFEVIAVDNGSSDRSVSILQTHLLKPRIIRLDQNLGFAGAVNLGLEQAQADLIALFNNDAVADQDWLFELVAGADKNPEFDFFASLILQKESPEKIESAGVRYTLQCRSLPIFENETIGGQVRPVEVFLASAAAVLIRNKLFDRIGKFDPDYFAYLEDLDFFLRARLAGARGMLVPQAVVYHLGAGTELKDQPGRKRMESGQRVYLISRNRWYLIWDNLPLSAIFLLIPLIKLGWLRGFGYHLFRSGRLGDFLKGTWSGFFSMFQRSKKRQTVKALRRIGLGELLGWMQRGFRPL